MDSLADYGSDDEYEENTAEKLGSAGGGRSDGGGYYNPEEADANYDQVQMDLSEESNNNNSEDDHRVNRQYSRPSTQEASRSDTRTNTRREDRSRKYDRSSHKRSRSQSPYERKVEYDRSPARKPSSSKDRSPKNYDRKRRRSRSRDRKRSDSRDRRRSFSRERRRSGSRDRRRSRSPRRQRRSRSKEREDRYGKGFDRTSNKMAQLEKLGIEIKTPDAEYITPQMLLQRTMDEHIQKIKNSTGIELPKYYNPAAMNPARYAEQIQKRRLLWQKKDDTQKETKPVAKCWEATTFAQDSDGKVASKFKRLMGIKDTASSSSDNNDSLKKQEEMFSSMQQQYEVARTATHTMRGVGLGFGSYQYPR